MKKKKKKDQLTLTVANKGLVNEDLESNSGREGTGDEVRRSRNSLTIH